MSQEQIQKIQVVDEMSIKGFFGEYRWLSNYHLSPIIYGGIEYPSVENAYQAAKTLDLEERKYFETCTPSEAKSAGRKVIIRLDWEEIKQKHMAGLIGVKFYNQELQIKLLNTGIRYLEETNWWGDKFWGVCDGQGHNVLGNILMHIRSKYARFYHDNLIKELEK